MGWNWSTLYGHINNIFIDDKAVMYKNKKSSKLKHKVTLKNKWEPKLTNVYIISASRDNKSYISTLRNNNYYSYVKI